MVEQVCFHDYERNVLADQVLDKLATRIDGQFNERQATAFRPWSWMETNRKVLVVCYLYENFLSSRVVADLETPSGIGQRCRPRERHGVDPSYRIVTHNGHV
jgi:hypothetical protein